MKVRLVIFLVFNFSYSQSKDVNMILKKYALYKCLTENYSQIDSAFVSHDYTASYIFQIKSIDYELLNQMDNYVQKNTANYYKNSVMENLDDKKANYICWHCLDFYESKYLDNFIRKLLSDKKRVIK